MLSRLRRSPPKLKDLFKKQLKISMISITMLPFEILKRYAETKEVINRRDGRHFTLPSALAVHKATRARCE